MEGLMRAAEGQCGPGGEVPVAGGWRSGSIAPIRRRQGGLRAKLPALGNFYDFSAKITYF